jgi:hypothetical protein
MRNAALPLDTSLEAARVQFAIWRRMTPDQKLRIISGLTETMRDLAAADIRRNNPLFTDERARLEVIRRCIGDKLFKAAFSNRLGTS